jgi:hypothetical protein
MGYLLYNSFYSTFLNIIGFIVLVLIYLIITNIDLAIEFTN